MSSILRVAGALAGCVFTALSCAHSSTQLQTSPDLAGGFRLRRLPDGLAASGRPGTARLRLVPEGRNLRVEVRIDNAQGLKAHYFELEYDSAAYVAISARGSGWLAEGPTPVLALAALDQPGRAACGQVLAQPGACRGVSGSGVAATFLFQRRSTAAPLRAARLAPATDASRAALALDAANTALNWTYYCQGDYDQNGEVNIADLTPLGIHFGQTGPFLINTVEGVVDGDGNGEINLADLTAIGLNYGRRVTGYRVFGSAAAGDYPAGNADPSALDALAFTELHEGNPAQERLRYTYTLDEVAAGVFYWVRPIDGAALDPAASEGTPSNMVSDADPGNLAPTAELAANPPVGLAPLQLRLSAEASTDPDGEIVLYEWDFDGDGLYDLTSLDSFIDLVISEAGEHIIAVRVTDNEGAVAGDGVLVVTTAPAGWGLSIPFVNPALDVWADEISQAIRLDGNPALVAENDYLGYYLCRATDAEATAWAAPRPIDSAGLYSGSYSFRMVGGAPALAFAGDGNTNLYFLRATHPLGDDWAAPQQILAYGGAYRPALLVSGNGLPLLAFLGVAGPGWSINALLSADALGSAWGGVIEIAGTDEFYSSPALGLLDGEPAAAFQDGVYNSVFARSVGEPDGSLWETQIAFDPPPLNGHSLTTPAFCEVAGRPALAFGFAAPGEAERIAFLRADDAAGTSWPAPQLVGDADELACAPALLVVAGRPVIAYATVAGAGDEAALKVIRAADGEGADWDPPESIGIFPDIRRLHALEMPSDRVGLAFRTFADAEEQRLVCRTVYFAAEQ